MSSFAHIILLLALVGPVQQGEGEVESGGGAFNVGGSNGQPANGSPSAAPPVQPVGDSGPSSVGPITQQPQCLVGGDSVCLEPALCADGSTMIVYSQTIDGTTYNWTSCGSSSPPGLPTIAPPSVTPGMVVRAFERIPLPESELNVQPPNGRTLVNLDTNFYTEEQDLDETVTLVGQQVDLRIWADSWTWDFGDGESLTTSKTGTPFPRLTLTHRYLQAESVDVAVDTVYAADYRVNGGPWAPVPGTVEIAGTPESLEVVEATPRLVG